jgi:hypothetical protein
MYSSDNFRSSNFAKPFALVSALGLVAVAGATTYYAGGTGANHYSTINAALSHVGSGDTLVVTAAYASASASAPESLDLTGSGYTIQFNGATTVASLQLDISQYGSVTFAGPRLIDLGNFTVNEGHGTPWPQVYTSLNGGSVEVLGNLTSYSSTFGGTTKLVIDGASAWGTANQSMSGGDPSTGGPGAFTPTVVNKGQYDKLVISGSVGFSSSDGSTSPSSPGSVLDIEAGEVDTTNGAVTVYGRQWGSWKMTVSGNATVFYGGWTGLVGFSSLNIGVGAGASVKMQGATKAYDLTLYGTASDWFGQVIAPDNLEVVHSFIENTMPTPYGPDEQFVAGDGTVTLDGVWTGNVSSGEGKVNVASPLNNVVFNLNQYNGVSICNSLSINGWTKFSGGSFPSLDGTGTIYMYGDVHAHNPYLQGTANLVFAGGLAQHWTAGMYPTWDGSSMIPGRLPNVTISKSGGVLDVDGAVGSSGYFTYAGTTGTDVDFSNSTVWFEPDQYNSMNVTPGALTFGNVTIAGGTWSTLVILNSPLICAHTVSNAPSAGFAGVGAGGTLVSPAIKYAEGGTGHFTNTSPDFRGTSLIVHF